MNTSTVHLKFDMEEWISDRLDALLSMDMSRILEHSRKYYGDSGFIEDDEHKFWIGVHRARSGSIDLPEAERRVSMAWLTERGYRHMAYDLEDESVFEWRTSILNHTMS